MKNRTELVNTMRMLYKELLKNHGDSDIARYIEETSDSLNKAEGVAFTGTLQYFFNNASTIKVSENFVFNDFENDLWHEILSYKQLGNNLWGVSL